MKRLSHVLLSLAIAVLPGCSLSAPHSQDSPWLRRLLSADPKLQPYLERAPEYRLQILYTQVDPQPAGGVRLSTHGYRVDADFYYPASLVKLPVAVLALERLAELGLDRRLRFELVSANRCSRYAAAGCDSVQSCIERLFVFSDNDAFNRLYEWLGPDWVNARLHARGYAGVLRQRFKRGCAGEAGRLTAGVRFYDASDQLVYTQAPQAMRGQEPVPRDDMQVGEQTRTRLGLVAQPMDFSQKSYYPLSSLHQMLIAIFYPQAVAPAQRWQLNSADQAFLLRAMALRPRDYGGDQADSFRKFLLLGSRSRMPESLSIRNKVGLSYGFMSDVSHIRDQQRAVEFFLSATLYVNSNGVMNDGTYDYDRLGYPFMQALGEALYRHAQRRQ